MSIFYVFYVYISVCVHIYGYWVCVCVPLEATQSSMHGIELERTISAQKRVLFTRKILSFANTQTHTNKHVQLHTRTHTHEHTHKSAIATVCIIL